MQSIGVRYSGRRGASSGGGRGGRTQPPCDLSCPADGKFLPLGREQENPGCEILKEAEQTKLMPATAARARRGRGSTEGCWRVCAGPSARA